MSWQDMRIPDAGPRQSLPGDRGRYLLWLDPPYVEGEGHYVHFSWKNSSFCIRDYINKKERRQDSKLSAVDVWAAATDRIPATGELYVPVENFAFWTTKLTELTERRNQGRSSTFWSRLSSRFASKMPDLDPADTYNSTLSHPFHTEESQGLYKRFISLWRRVPRFEVIERTIGCSARFEGVPVLWVFPSYFQIAPQGKGNSHYLEVKKLWDQHFPEFSSRGTIQFGVDNVDWDQFEKFIRDVQEAVKHVAV